MLRKLVAELSLARLHSMLPRVISSEHLALSLVPKSFTLSRYNEPPIQRTSLLLRELFDSWEGPDDVR